MRGGRPLDCAVIWPGRTRNDAANQRPIFSSKDPTHG